MSMVDATCGGLRPTPAGERIGVARADLRLPMIAALTVAALLAVQVGLVLVRLDGHFSYTLDDPYIHLALASQIAQGHYGLAPGVPAAPSSSILYPFLLAALLRAGLGAWGPLAVNAAATLASAALLAAIVGEAAPRAARMRTLPLALLAASAAMGLNLVGVAMTGMEHGLQVALTLAWLLGASRFLRRGAVAPWWAAVAVSGPLVRYENATLLLAAVALMALRRRPGAALGLLAAGAAGVVAFSLFLHARGLPWLPSSILAKSAVRDPGNRLAEVGPALHVPYTVLSNLLQPDGVTLLAAAMGVALMVARRARSGAPRDRDAVLLGAVALAVSGAQLAAGRVDGFSRYAVYATVLDVAVAALGFAPEIAAAALGFAPEIAAAARRPARGRGVAVVAAAGALLLASVDVHRSVRADLAARNIYEQQHQMHRLAADFYRAPVAVNDLGEVAFDNPYPVLDLWGLGSEEARLARRDDPSGRWMAGLADRHRVGLAMIYDACFPRIPDGWVRRATLRLGGPLESAAFDAVALYATSPGAVAGVDAALDRWGPTLPAGVGLDREPRP